jgi:hypothetical protein
LYGAPVVPSLWPDTHAIEEAVKAATELSLQTDYSWLGHAGHEVFKFELDPIGLASGVLGAIFVVLMGLYLARENNMAEASKQLPSAKAAH